MNANSLSGHRAHAAHRLFSDAAQAAAHDVVFDAFGPSRMAFPLASAEVPVSRNLDLVESVVEVVRRHTHSRAQAADLRQGRRVYPWAVSIHQRSEFVAQDENPLPLGAFHVYAYIR